MAVVVPVAGTVAGLEEDLEPGIVLEVLENQAVVCIVGHGIEQDGALRGEVASAVALLRPEAMTLGASALAVAAVVPEEQLSDAVRTLHARFFEGAGGAS